MKTSSYKANLTEEIGTKSFIKVASHTNSTKKLIEQIYSEEPKKRTQTKQRASSDCHISSPQ
jgi:hypothetical protein